MARFRKPPDPVFWRINRSLEFDRRLAPQDLAVSRAHARALAGAGILDDVELEAILSGLERIAAEFDSDEFPFAESDEDIHMAIERRLTEIAGAAGAKIHTARSRNDQVATDVALFVREHCVRAGELAGAVMSELLALAERHADWVMPGYTHLQRAQPVYLGHHLLAYFWMLARDVSRFRRVRDAAGRMPLGAGALAGVGWELDHDAVAAELGFDGPAPNSIDAVASRDQVLDYLAAASICATHLSRLGAEVVIWSTSEFGFCEPAEEFSSGSSIMPQKKNPDAAELLRAKAPRIAAAFASVSGALHALPMAYSKDMQEDKEPLFDAVDNLELALEVAAGLLRGISFDRERLATAAADETIAAVDLADLLVNEGIPFRQAHDVVGSLVREAEERGLALSQLDFEALDERLAGLGPKLAAVIGQGGWTETKVSAGGTGSARLAEQLEAARAELDRVTIG